MDMTTSVPVNRSPIVGELVTIPLPDGSGMGGYLARPRGPGPHRAVVVAHELFAVNDDIGAVVDRLAGLGYVAVAPELYHRAAPAGTTFARDDEGRAAAFELLHGVTRATASADVEATIAFLAHRDDTTGAVAMIGFSLGGHIAYLAATRFDLVATVVLYGGWLTGTDIELSQPEATVELTPGIAAHHGRLLFLVGDDDHLIPVHDRAAIPGALKAAGVSHEIVAYPDTAHAFFWEGTQTFNRTARDDAWNRIEAFLPAP